MATKVKQKSLTWSSDDEEPTDVDSQGNSQETEQQDEQQDEQDGDEENALLTEMDEDTQTFAAG